MTPADCWGLARLDGLAQSELVRNGEVTARELADAAIARIDELDSQLGSVAWRMDDLDRQLAALDADGAVDSPLWGVPTLLKDVNTPYAGSPRWDGSRFIGGVIDEHDAELVTRMRRAGLVFVGKSTSSELGNTNETSWPGPTNNPWDLSRSTGGSSAGAGAAVAARLVPLAHGSDAGGSIRWPAAWCGVFGLKPTRARNPLGPDGTEGCAGLTVAHVLTISVRDSAAALDALHGRDTGAPYVAPAASGSYLEALGRDPGPLRIGLLLDAPDGREVDPHCRQAALHAAALCEEMGHHVEEAAPRYDVETLVREFEGVAWDGNAATLDALEDALGRTATEDDFDPITWWLMQRGRTRTASDHINGIGRLHAAARDAAAFFDTYDMLLSPANPTPPGTHEELSPAPDEVEWVWANRELGGGIFMLLANTTGQPAMSVPLVWTDGGLPVGSHFTAGLGREDLLLQIAGQLERAQPWAGRVPDITPV
jgi:amidase